MRKNKNKIIIGMIALAYILQVAFNYSYEVLLLLTFLIGTPVLIYGKSFATELMAVLGAGCLGVFSSYLYSAENGLAVGREFTTFMCLASVVILSIVLGYVLTLKYSRLIKNVQDIDSIYNIHRSYSRIYASLTASILLSYSYSVVRVLHDVKNSPDANVMNLGLTIIITLLLFHLVTQFNTYKRVRTIKELLSEKTEGISKESKTED